MNLKYFLSKRTIIWSLRIILTVLFVLIANKSLTGNDLAILRQYLRYWPLFLAFVLGCAGLWCQILRWQIILRYQNLPSGLRVAAKSILLGILLAFVTPGRIGEFFRGFSISRDKKNDTVLAVIIDKLFIVLATFILGIVCAIIQVRAIGTPLPEYVIAMSAAAAIICLLVALFLLTRPKSSRAGGVARIFHKLLTHTPKLFSKSGQLAALLSFAAQALCILQTVVLIRMFGCASARDGFVAIGQAYAFMSFLPVSIANIGIREYSFGIFLGNIGATCPGNLSIQTVSLGVSIWILIMNLILPALAGLIWNFVDGVMRLANTGNDGTSV
jgi:hypothetical protein